jgi:calcineurin-like phosphoesterase family protein
VSAIYVTSDWHFNHDRDFIWGPRGCANVEEMNKAIIENHNKVVGWDDDVYVLGDLVFGRDIQDGLNKIRRLNGRIHVVIGNHDSEKKIQEYQKLKQIVEIKPVIALKHNGFSFWLTHYPTITENYNLDEIFNNEKILKYWMKNNRTYLTRRLLTLNNFQKNLNNKIKNGINGSDIIYTERKIVKNNISSCSNVNNHPNDLNETINFLHKELQNTANDDNNNFEGKVLTYD